MPPDRPSSPFRIIRNSVLLLTVSGVLLLLIFTLATKSAGNSPEGSPAWWGTVLEAMFHPGGSGLIGCLALAGLNFGAYFALRTLFDPKTWRAWWRSNSVQDDDPGGGPGGMPEFLRSDRHPRE
jgi:hypothetical protein